MTIASFASPNPNTPDFASTRSASAVSWGAIIAGAAAAAALSLILLILGTGLGLSAVSPWSQSGVSATTFGVSTILWLALTQLLASGMGGYLAGRLRTKWVSVHTDEVYFRDTAHGFLAWAVASLATAALLTSTIGAIMGSGAQLGATVAASGAAMVAGQGLATADAGNGSAGPTGYYIDSLFRADAGANSAPANGPSGAPSSPDSGTAGLTAEAGRILANGLRNGALAADDMRYLGQRVAHRTGLSAADAEMRVGSTFTRLQSALRNAEATAKEAADKARNASAYAALWLFISLLIGAFVASLAATFGGRQRDL